MSLMDTIRGAREEASANGNPFESAKEIVKKSDDEPKPQSGSSGFARRSAANAKPSREASAGVRVVTTSGKTKKGSENLTKEERKAEKRAQRTEEDRRFAVSEMLLKEDAEYVRMRKVWRNLLIAGVVFLVIAMVLYGIVNQQGAEANVAMAFVAMGSMVIAYGFVIADFIYDWVKIRPLKKKADQRAASMTNKKINNMLRQRDAK